MAQFLESLMNSIFTPGPTPTLLLATNLAFGALSLLLLALLAFTQSIHFLILSILSAALWWSINWFAAEVRLAQEREEQTLKDGEDDTKSGGDREGDADVDGAGDELSSGDGEEIEVESEKKAAAAGKGSMKPPPPRVSSKPLASSTTSSRSLAPNTQDDAAARQRQQRRSMAESTGSLSTDSEWEKVEGER